jgi:hypothetical protein
MSIFLDLWNFFPGFYTFNIVLKSNHSFIGHMTSVPIQCPLLYLKVSLQWALPFILEEV